MKNPYLQTLLFLLLATVPCHTEEPIGQEQITQAENLYSNRCKNCHGRKGKKKALGRSKRLKDIDQADVINKLEAYLGNPPTRGMKDKMKSGLSPEEIRALSTYIHLQFQNK